jgi:magnesium and cobalt transporter
MSSSGQTGSTGSWLRRLANSITGEPRDLDELVAILVEARERGLIDADVLQMLESVLEVSEIQVRDIMVPRSQMVVINRDEPVEKILPVVIESGHSRFPVVGEDRDEVQGILLAKDLLRHFAGKEFDLRDTLRPAIFIPESKRLNVLLREFRASRNHMAIVVDEYGGVAGLVTIEDVLEQIVGDIEDEYDFDETEDNIVSQPGGRFRIKATTELADFNAAFRTEYSDEDYDTVGGLIMNRFGRVPKRGEEIAIDDFTFKVLRADSRRVHSLLVERKNPPEA